jgi:hypothetical protein
MGSSDAARRAGTKVASIETVGTINPTAIAIIGPWGANELNIAENTRGSGNARSKPIVQPIADSVAPLPQDQAENIPFVRAQRHADADLARSLGYRICDNAINPHTAASSRGRQAKTLRSSTINLSPPALSSTRSCMVQILPTGWRLFTAHTARCNMGASGFD